MRIFELGTRKNTKKQPFFAEKWADFGCFRIAGAWNAEQSVVSLRALLPQHHYIDCMDYFSIIDSVFQARRKIFEKDLKKPNGWLDNAKANRRRRFKFRYIQYVLTTFVYDSCMYLWAQKGLLWESAADRRHTFRYAQCALTTFIHGNACTCRRMKAYLERGKRTQ